MINKFKQFLDWADKFFKRFKAFGYLIAIVFIVFYFIENGFENREAIRMAEKITGLDMQKDLLIKEKANVKFERDSLLNENYNLKVERDEEIELKEKYKKKSIKEEIAKNNAIAALEFFTSNENYRYLQDIAYPYLGELEYGFNERQVKEMRKTHVENEFNMKLLKSKTIQLNICESALTKSLIIEKKSDTIYKKAEEEIAISDSITSIEEQKVDVLTKDKFGKKLKRFWQKIDNYIIPAATFLIGKSL